jgi:preprotein translocase subunit SecF
MLRIFPNAKFDYIRPSRLTGLASALFIIPGLLWVLFAGYQYSIEFTGGTLMQLQFAQDADIARVRSAATAAGVGDVEIQTFGTPRDVIVRAQGATAVQQQAEGAAEVERNIRAALGAEFGDEAYEVLRTENVGPKVGSELRRNAVIAVLISFLVTLVYLAWRFEWRFGVAALVATIHDIVATLAFMRYMDIEVSLFVVGGILTVIGYSLNDTIVVFDRVRENLHTHHKPTMYEVLNRSLNETLPRTVMTGTTTLATLLALVIFGGEVIRPFAWVLIFGIIVGTYSSIFVAAPVLLAIEKRWPRTVAATRAAPAAAGARRPA